MHKHCLHVFLFLKKNFYIISSQRKERVEWRKLLTGQKVLNTERMKMQMQRSTRPIYPNISKARFCFLGFSPKIIIILLTDVEWPLKEHRRKDSLHLNRDLDRKKHKPCLECNIFFGLESASQHHWITRLVFTNAEPINYDCPFSEPLFLISGKIIWVKFSQ